jgi:hypothetical protein
MRTTGHRRDTGDLLQRWVLRWAHPRSIPPLAHTTGAYNFVPQYIPAPATVLVASSRKNDDPIYDSDGLIDNEWNAALSSGL